MCGPIELKVVELFYSGPIFEYLIYTLSLFGYNVADFQGMSKNLFGASLVRERLLQRWNLWPAVGPATVIVFKGLNARGVKIGNVVLLTCNKCLCPGLILKVMLCLCCLFGRHWCGSWHRSHSILPGVVLRKSLSKALVGDQINLMSIVVN